MLSVKVRMARTCTHALKAWGPGGGRDVCVCMCGVVWVVVWVVGFSSGSQRVLVGLGLL